MRDFSPRTSLALALVVCLATAGVFALSWLSPAMLDAETPPGLLEDTCVGRLDNGSVDVVMWDGEAWQQALSSSAIGPLERGNDVLQPRIKTLLVSPDGNTLALWVVFCDGDIEERDSCTARAYVHDVDGTALTQLREDVAPVAWVEDGAYLLVEDYMADYGELYDPETGNYSPLADIDDLYSLPNTPEGVSPDGDHVLVSGELGEGWLRRSTAQVTWLASPSPHNTAWMALSPDQRSASVVRIRTNEDNRLGGGAVQLYDTTGSMTETVTSGTQHLDFNPTWAAGGSRLAFLRSDARALRDNVLAYGSDSQNLPAGVVAFDIEAHTTDVLASPDAVRRGLIAPGNGDTLLFLQRDAGVYTAYYLNIGGGHAQPILADGLEHTAIGVSR